MLAPGHPERVIIIDESQAVRVPRWLERFGVGGDVAVACPVETLDGKQSQDDIRDAQCLLQVRYDGFDLGPPRVADIERPDHPRARADVRHHRSHHASHPASVTARTENPRRIMGRPSRHAASATRAGPTVQADQSLAWLTEEAQNRQGWLLTPCPSNRRPPAPNRRSRGACFSAGVARREGRWRRVPVATCLTGGQ
jgi:hypothetical protein